MNRHVPTHIGVTLILMMVILLNSLFHLSNMAQQQQIQQIIASENDSALERAFTLTTSVTPLPTTPPPTATSTLFPAVFNSSGIITPGILVQGQTGQVRTTLIAGISNSNTQVEVSVCNGACTTTTMLMKMVWKNQHFSAGQTRIYTTNWRVPNTYQPTPSTLRVRIRVLNSSGGSILHTNSQATTFVVDNGNPQTLGCAGDVNGDNTITSVDYSLVRGQMSTAAPDNTCAITNVPGPEYCRADVNNSNTITTADATFVQQNIGQACP